MGKWTSGYYDDVLSSKIKSLVSGAIKRSKLDKTEPEINFERFVEELDAGDSFTTSIFDILVNELADRQSRSNVDDRRLIGERTARSLRIITTSNKVYFSSSFSHRVTGRSRSHIYYPGPPEDIDLEEDEEEDEFSALLDTDTTLRQQHDAMMETAGASSVLPSFAARSSSPAPIAPTDEPISFILFASSNKVKDSGFQRFYLQKAIYHPEHH
ncbi:Cytoplasmic dynein 1 light intermediate chain 1 [Lentinula edodes]|uniref:Cytoplasmic dynein 1 light intermediate chain 1 n=1 Tax=Lentinula edodes TaxID=5353 RepID=A0A1Q3E7Q3_LENED|nr:Cytoplasmic dynein 1 light intermediate chain 1 [Lentinula edodes]